MKSSQPPSVQPAPATGPRPFSLPFWWALGTIGAVLALTFIRSFSPNDVLFANDGPLGSIVSQYDLLLSNLFGIWQPLNWVGGELVSNRPTISLALGLPLTALLYANFYAPLCLLVLGVSAWFCFRQWGFHPAVCLLGGLAACFNMNAFSNACWGLPSWALAWAMVFLASAALASKRMPRTWMKLALAGLAVGMGVNEGYDVAAIFSLYVAAFAFFLTLMEKTPVNGGQIAKAVARVALVAFCAVLMAAQTLTSLIGTQVKGIAGTQQDEKTKEERWDFATQWSLPKVETLRVVIPGLFGYRMDTPEGGNYWGAVGRQPGWEKHHQGYPRHTGSGEYAGVLVVLLALWALAQSLRGRQCPYSPDSRRIIWFWAGAAAISLLLAYGRHAPFYRIVYALPYFSTIRNPIKFLQPFHVAMLILFAHGLQDLYRRFLESGTPTTHSIGEQLKRWWAAANPFDRKWTTGSGIALAAALFGWLLYAAQRGDLVKYLQTVGFDASQSAAIARFSLGEVGWFVLFLGLAALFVTVILSGAFAGRRAKWAMLMLGLLLVVDLSRANQPWIKYYDYKEKYASNPVIDILREKPFERRVAVVPAAQLQEFYANVYHQLWLQHHFPYYGIQSLDIAQEPRMPQEKIDYITGLSQAPIRYWQLTNTRLLFGMNRVQPPQGPVSFADLLNQQLDPDKRRFRLHTAFDLVQAAPDKTVSARTNAAGQFALIEFTGALPRARLYANWEVIEDSKATLKRLIDPVFDPEQLVLVSGQLPPPGPGGAANQAAGTVEFAHYSPKHLKLNADARTSSILLLNDRFHPGWKVWVNGQPAPLLRCNFIMRGVRLEPGKSVVELRFQPPVSTLYVSLGALGFGLALCGFLAFSQRQSPTAPPETSLAAGSPKPGKRPPK